MDDGAGARSEAHVLVQLAQAGQRAVQIERRVVARGAAQLLGEIEREASDLFLAVLHHHLIGTGLDRGRGTAEGHRATGGRLQPQRRAFERMGQRRIAVRIVGTQRADVGEARAQALLETGQVLDRAGFVGTRDDRFDRGVAAPQVRTAQRADA
ncbi:hypothetical protein OJJOAM_000999 [Cupriavidus sp. H18C1]